jgi:hypothetical protein
MHPIPQQTQRSELEQFAFSEGLRVGRLKYAANLNPHPIDSDLYKEWYRGWYSATGAQLFRARGT